MRIGMVCPYSFDVPGGVQSHVLQLAEVMRERGTERPFVNKCANPYQNGTFVCAACGNPLFEASTKFESGTGWPSYWQPVAPENVSTPVVAS